MNINPALANHLIERVADYSKYNINIINKEGIIIAASIDKSRIGSFHEIAYNMIREKIPCTSTEPGGTFLGTRYGMNLLLEYSNEVIGVVGMTGLPSEVEPIIHMVKQFIETMVEYEYQMEFVQLRKNHRFRFMNTLLFSEEPTALAELPKLANTLGYSERVYRIPVLLCFSVEVNSSALTQFVYSAQSYSSQDIVLTPDQKEILIFKALTQNITQMFENYAFIIGDMLNPLLKHAKENNIPCKCFVGSIQNKFTEYRYAYKHCNWLRYYYQNGERQAYYFYDHIQEYINQQIPLTRFQEIFEPIVTEMPENVRSNLIELVPVLQRNDFNLNQASQELFVHKNTLVFRLNKLRDFMSINPVQDYTDRQLLYYLYYYVVNRQK